MTFEVLGQLVPVLAGGVANDPRIRWMMHAWTVASGQTAFTESGRPFSPSQTTKNTSCTPPLRSSVSTAVQNFAGFPVTVSGPHAEDVLLTVQVDPVAA